MRINLHTVHLPPPYPRSPALHTTGLKQNSPERAPLKSRSYTGAPLPPPPSPLSPCWHHRAGAGWRCRWWAEPPYGASSRLLSHACTPPPTTHTPSPPRLFAGIGAKRHRSGAASSEGTLVCPPLYSQRPAQDSAAKQPADRRTALEPKPRLCHLLAVQPWPSVFTPLSLSPRP